MWPGYGDNMRVLEWIIGRVNGTAKAVDTEIGLAPSFSDMNWNGFSMTEDQFKELSKVDAAEWMNELKLQDELIEKLKDRLPKKFLEIRKTIQARFESLEAPTKRSFTNLSL
jgi:phosphoenolpyruvate carboxykinase (GTP)